MFCNQCGQKLEEGTLICPVCGHPYHTPVATTKAKKSRKWLIPVIAGAAVITSVLVAIGIDALIGTDKNTRSNKNSDRVSYSDTLIDMNEDPNSTAWYDEETGDLCMYVADSGIVYRYDESIDFLYYLDDNGSMYYYDSATDQFCAYTGSNTYTDSYSGSVNSGSTNSSSSSSSSSCMVCGGAGSTTCNQCGGDGYMESSGFTASYGTSSGGSYSTRKPCTAPRCNGGRKDCPSC